MTGEEAKQIVAILKAAFPRQTLEPETVRVYAMFLRDFDEAQATAAVKRLVSTSKFFPTIAEIREAIAEQAVGLPGVQAFVEHAMTRHTIPVTERRALTTEEKRAIEAVGGSFAVRESTNPVAMRAQLRDAYAAIRTEAVRAVQTGEIPALPAAPIERLAAATAPALSAPALRTIE